MDRKPQPAPSEDPLVQILEILRRLDPTTGRGPADLLSITQAAQRVGVHPNTIRRAIRSRSEADRLPAYNVALKGRRLVKIDPADLERWAKRSPAADPPPARPMTRTTPRKSRHFKL